MRENLHDKQENDMKTGIIDVGGGMRGIYAAGVFDRCLDNGVHFDVCIGVSAGSANGASFIAGQRKRNYAFYTEYAFRKEYMGLRNFVTKRSYIDLDYVYGTLSNTDGEYPLDYDAFAKNPTEYVVVATDAVTGKAVYFTKTEIERDHYDALKASSALPFFCMPYSISGKAYYDGALGDCIPLTKAFQMGCDKVVLILTKPKDVVRKVRQDAHVASKIQKKYPQAANALRNRAWQYNRGVEMAKRLEKEGRVLIVAPDDTCGVDTLTKSKEALDSLYEKGYKDGLQILAYMDK